MSLLYRKMKNQMEQKYIEKDKKNLFDIESEDEVIQDQHFFSQREIKEQIEEKP